MSDLQMRLNTKPLYSQVRDVLVAKVTSGEWKPGVLLPNENQIAQTMQVSTGTVRKALDMLEAERIVTRRQGRGTFVNDYSALDAPSRFPTIFDTDGQPISGVKRLKGMARMSAGADCALQLDVSLGDEVIRIDRRRFHNDECFMTETYFLPARLFPKSPQDPVSHRLSALAQENGLVIGTAQERVDITSASEEDASDLEVSEGTPLLRLSRHVYCERKRVLEWRVARCYLRQERYLVQFNN